MLTGPSRRDGHVLWRPAWPTSSVPTTGENQNTAPSLPSRAEYHDAGGDFGDNIPLREDVPLLKEANFPAPFNCRLHLPRHTLDHAQQPDRLSTGLVQGLPSRAPMNFIRAPEGLP